VSSGGLLSLGSQPRAKARNRRGVNGRMGPPVLVE
jgi:hypothetical protein